MFLALMQAEVGVSASTGISQIVGSVSRGSAWYFELDTMT